MGGGETGAGAGSAVLRARTWWVVCDAGTCELEDAEVRKMKMVGKSLAVPMRRSARNDASIDHGPVTYLSATILLMICQRDLRSQWVMLKICSWSRMYLEP